MSPAKKRRVGDLVEPRVLDRVGHGGLDELDADDLARPRGERQADRADAAVEVEDALVAAQRGELGGVAVEHLGHLGVGLEERLGRDQEAQVAELLGELRRAGEQRRLAALGALAEPRGLGPEQARRASTRVDQRVGVELAGRGDEPDLQLAGARGPRGRRGCAGSPAACGGPRRRGPGGAARRAPARARRWRARRRACSRPSARIRSKRPGAWKPHTSSPSVAGAERVLELVAVAPLLERRDDRLELVALEPADAGQRVVDLLLLDLELALVGEHLPRRAGVVGDLGMRSGDGSRSSTARASAYALGLADHGADAVAGHGAGDEDDVAVPSRRATPLPP